jgi:hypothetical protein
VERVPSHLNVGLGRIERVLRSRELAVAKLVAAA